METKSLAEWMEEGRGKGGIPQFMTRRIYLNDGEHVSIQASDYSYCTPRKDLDYEHYLAMELGFPSFEDELLKQYAEDSNNLTETVYGYVPVSVIEAVIEKHGGIYGHQDPKIG